MKKLSAFDLGIIIAFVVVALLGGGAWYYLSGQLDATKQDVAAAAGDFQKYSSRQTYLPTAANAKTLTANIALIQAQLNPIIQSKLLAPGNKLASVAKEDTVAWKHDLDTEVSGLNNAAKLHGVTVPNNFYYGFSRYLNQNPGDEQTFVLSKQLDGVEELATIFIKAPVKSIATFRRTYEEDPNSSGTGAPSTDPDFLPGTAEAAPGNVYVAYPFEIEFEATTDSFRKVVNDLEKSPYVFVIRTLTIQNSNATSPQISDLQKLAGTPAAGVLDSSPGAVGTTKSTKGPQFLFGNETLHIKARIDMIEWNGITEATPASPARRNRGAGRGGNE
jgi:hypothetical protein